MPWDKKRTIEMLSYPRDRMRDGRELDQCSHTGFPDRADPHCRECRYAADCDWLYSYDEFVDLNAKPLEELVAALEFTTGYLEAEMDRIGHDPASCRCEGCTWLQDARRYLTGAGDPTPSPR